MSIHFLENFCPARILYKIFGERRMEEKLYRLENVVENSVFFR